MTPTVPHSSHTKFDSQGTDSSQISFPFELLDLVFGVDDIGEISEPDVLLFESISLGVKGCRLGWKVCDIGFSQSFCLLLFGFSDFSLFRDTFQVEHLLDIDIFHFLSTHKLV